MNRILTVALWPAIAIVGAIRSPRSHWVAANP